jgi:hypothetical protein
MVVEPMYIEILNDDLVGFSNTTSRYMVDHILLSYGSITAVDIEKNFENMRKAWYPQQPVETLFKQIQDCVDFAEAGGVTIVAAQKLSSAYSKIFKSGKFTSACPRWDEKIESDKTWNNLKIHFAVAYCQHRQIQGETVGAQGYANAAVAQSEEELAEQAMGAFANLSTATSVDRGTTWEDTKSTGVDFCGRHLNIIAKYLMIGVPQPCLKTTKQPL